jgi:hypothetical protein
MPERGESPLGATLAMVGWCCSLLILLQVFVNFFAFHAAPYPERFPPHLVNDMCDVGATQHTRYGPCRTAGRSCPRPRTTSSASGRWTTCSCRARRSFPTLGLQRYGYRGTPLEAPYGWIGDDGSTLLLFHDRERTLAEVRRYSAKDARAYAELQPALSWIFDALTTVMPRHPADLPKKDLGKLLLKLPTGVHGRADL